MARLRTLWPILSGLTVSRAQVAGRLIAVAPFRPQPVYLGHRHLANLPNSPVRGRTPVWPARAWKAPDVVQEALAATTLTIRGPPARMVMATAHTRVRQLHCGRRPSHRHTLRYPGRRGTEIW